METLKFNEFNDTRNNKSSISESENTNVSALLVSVYKSPNGDSSANGLSSKHDKLLLVYDGMQGPFKTKDNEDYLVLVKRNIGSEEYLSAKPKSLIDSNTQSMFGGNFIYTSDSRFPNKYPIAIHDRVEIK